MEVERLLLMGMVVTLFAAALIAAAALALAVFIRAPLTWLTPVLEALALAALVLWELRREAKRLFCQLGWRCGASEGKAQLLCEP
jgi:fatty acid desaturase